VAIHSPFFEATPRFNAELAAFVRGAQKGELTSPSAQATRGGLYDGKRDWPDLVGRRDGQLGPVDGSEMSLASISRPAE
jgi:hypothetical protein